MTAVSPVALVAPAASKGSSSQPTGSDGGEDFARELASAEAGADRRAEHETLSPAPTDADAAAEAVTDDAAAVIAEAAHVVSAEAEADAAAAVAEVLPDAVVAELVAEADAAAQAAQLATTVATTATATTEAATASTPATAEAAPAVRGSQPAAALAQSAAAVVTTDAATTAHGEHGAANQQSQPQAQAAPLATSVAADQAASQAGVQFVAEATAASSKPVAQVPTVQGTTQIPAGFEPVATVQPAATTSTAPAQSANAPAPAFTFPTPLPTQLGHQLMSIRQLPQGNHVLMLTVNPESFGPVKVVAHIGTDGVSLELFGASEAAKAALKAALPDLRRDLVGAGLDPNLELGDDASEWEGGFGQSSDGDGQPGFTPGKAAGPASTATTQTIPTPAPTHPGGVDLIL